MSEEIDDGRLALRLEEVEDREEFTIRNGGGPVVDLYQRNDM